MAFEITIPRLGWSMEEGIFVRWLKPEGAIVRRGEPLFELEGEKALQEIEAVDEGILRIPPDAPPPGATVPVGKVLAWLVAEGEPLPWEATSGAESAGTIAEQATVAVSQETIRAQILKPAEDRRAAAIASPRARRIAKELGVDWTRLSASGRGGRIRERDVRDAAKESAIPNSAGKKLPITARRRKIAERMMASRQQVVPVTLTTQADATRLVELREKWKNDKTTPVAPSYQDLIVKLVVSVLARHPILAGRWDDDAIALPADDDLSIGIAVDTEEGLLVPVIREARSLSIADIAEQSRELIEKARRGKLTAAEMQGGVFTVTNLGAFGIDAFTPVINYPESAILGLGAIRRTPVFLDDDTIAARPILTLSLTFDHRVVDGAPAARFLQELVAAIQGATL